jgi:hypothetical protein
MDKILEFLNNLIKSINLYLPLILVCIGLFALYQFFYGDKNENKPGDQVIAKPAKEVLKVERIIERPKIVYVYPDSAKEKLPEPVKNDPKEKLVAATRVEPDDNPHTVSTVLNTETGVFTTFDRTDPQPWIGTDHRGEVMAAYGIKNGDPTGRLQVNQNIIRMKSLRLGATGSVDTDSDWFAGGYVSYKW